MVPMHLMPGMLGGLAHGQCMLTFCMTSPAFPANDLRM